jgi:hypothetical protein
MFKPPLGSSVTHCTLPLPAMKTNTKRQQINRIPIPSMLRLHRAEILSPRSLTSACHSHRARTARFGDAPGRSPRGPNYHSNPKPAFVFNKTKIQPKAEPKIRQTPRRQKFTQSDTSNTKTRKRRCRHPLGIAPRNGSPTRRRIPATKRKTRRAKPAGLSKHESTRKSLPRRRALPQ